MSLTTKLLLIFEGLFGTLAAFGLSIGMLAWYCMFPELTPGFAAIAIAGLIGYAVCRFARFIAS